MITAKQIKRPLRFVIFAGLAITVGIFLRSRSSGEKLVLQKGDRSMVPAYYPGTSVEARRIDADFELRRERDVLYVMKGKGFLGRVRGLPGDTITSVDGALHRNGKRMGPRSIPAGATGLGKVPEGKLCILNVNPDPKYSDSREFGFIPRDQVQAIIVKEIR